MCCSNPHQAVPFTTVTASHVTQGRLEYKSMIPRGTDEGLDLREVVAAVLTSYVKDKQWLKFK
jgi:hypothetical protein